MLIFDYLLVGLVALFPVVVFLGRRSVKRPGVSFVILLCRTSGTRVYRGRDLILDQKSKDQVDTEVG
jgi:hypothetical protein